VDMQAELNPQLTSPDANFVAPMMPWNLLQAPGDFAFFTIVHNQRDIGIINYPFATTAYPALEGVVSTLQTRFGHGAHILQPELVFQITNTGLQDTNGSALYSIISLPANNLTNVDLFIFNSSGAFVNTTNSLIYLANSSIQIGIPIASYSWSISSVRSMAFSLPVQSVYALTMTQSTTDVPIFAIHSVNPSRAAVIQPANQFGWFVGRSTWTKWGMTNGGVGTVSVVNTTANDTNVIWDMSPVEQMYINLTNNQTVCTCLGMDCPRCSAQIQGMDYAIQYQLNTKINITKEYTAYNGSYV